MTINQFFIENGKKINNTNNNFDYLISFQNNNLRYKQFGVNN